MLLGLPHNDEKFDKATPFFLVYGREAVLSLKIQISSL